MNREGLKYRQSTLAVVVNKKKKFLVVNKKAYEPDKWWSFPGGGIDTGETPEQAVMRELLEELKSNKFEIIGKSKHDNQYKWPDEVIEKTFKEKGKHFRGTQLVQFWVKFLGEEHDIRPGDGIRTVKWVTRKELKKYLLFPNQLTNAEMVIQEFVS